MKLAKDPFEIEIYVIGKPGFLRNPNLERDLPGRNLNFVEPVRVASAREALSSHDMEANMHLFGRELLSGEVGCRVAHEKARSRIHGDWALVLEDDAAISREQIEVAAEFLSRLEPEVPTVVTLHDQNHVDKGRPELKKLKYMPGTTLAYFVSRPAAQLDLLDNRSVGTADWPLSFARAKFFSLSGLGVGEYEAESSIDRSGKVRGRSVSRHYFQVLKALPALIQQLGPSVINFALIWPIRRDLSGRLSRIR